MNPISDTSKISKTYVKSHLKRKVKQYLKDVSTEEFCTEKYQCTTYPVYLYHALYMVIDEILSDSFSHVKKNNEGIYTINLAMVQNAMYKSESTKYDNVLKYFKKYNTITKYADLVFFDFNKTVNNLETKCGDKLMVEPECRNFIAYLVSSLQYEILNLSTMMVEHSGRKTLSPCVLLKSIKFLFGDLYQKIKTKLDSLNEIKETVGENVQDATDEHLEEAGPKEEEVVEPESKIEIVENSLELSTAPIEEEEAGDVEDVFKKNKKRSSKKRSEKKKTI